MGQGGMGAGQGNPQLQQLTGELGQKVVGQLQERMGRGDFGQVMASLGKPAAAGAVAWLPVVACRATCLREVAVR